MFVKQAGKVAAEVKSKIIDKKGEKI